MKESLESYQHLTNNALMYLNKMGYAHRSLDRFQQEWIKIGEFMKINSIEIYTPKIGELYLKHCSGHLKYEQLDEYQLNQIRFVSVLSDFTLTGTITASKRRTKTEQLEGVIGKSMIDWILDYQKHHNIKPYTAGCYYRCLSKLMVFLHKNEIFDTKDITPNILVEFTNSLQEFNYGVIREIITKMNKYLFHLYETGITSRNLSAIIKKPKFVRNPKLPNYYTKEEIEQIVSKINRATPEGKRDYAIILLAARLGLRTSDISNLSFSNINWEKSTISICQTKTGQMVDLPLLPEVGNAIVEYLRFGRPVSESKSVF